MAVYRCSICGELYDEEREGVPFSELPDDWRCPLCRSPKSAFVRVGEEAPAEKVTETEEPTEPSAESDEAIDLSYDPMLVQTDGGAMDEIHSMAITGRSSSAAMDTQAPNVGFERILILGAQLSRFPLDDDAEVSLETVIGKKAEKPMVIGMPAFVSHMSFGALSYEAKKALAMGSARAGTAMCSGEGGALPDEMRLSHRYIFEYVPNRYSCTTATFEGCDAVEIKIGQGTKPGMGGHLPGNKVTEVISAVRQRPVGQDILSPSRFRDIGSPEDMRKLVDQLRERTGGKPIGIKIAAGDIEGDLEFISKTGCDFITIDGRGGATGSSPGFLRDNSSVPTVYALARARRYMDAHGMDQELVITGGLRTGGDVAKALAMGADAVALASAPLMALACQRYRICGSGRCPMGIATHDPELTARLDPEIGAERVRNYFDALAAELRTFARITGHGSIHDLSMDDIVTIDRDIAEYANVRHA